MEIIKDNLSDLDCLIMQQVPRARASQKKGETASYAANVVENQMK